MQTIVFVSSALISAYVIGWAWGASTLYFKQLLEKAL